MTVSPIVPAGFPDTTGITSAEIAAFDWPATSLGPVETWPAALRSILALMLACPTPMFLAWGPELLCFYNDAYRPILGYRAETALGRPFRQVWASIWTDIAPLVDATLAGETRTMTDMPLDLSRNQSAEQSWWTFTYSPAFDDDGGIAGLFCVTGETTANVVAQRQRAEAEERLRANVERQRLRVEIGDALRLLNSPSQIMAFVADRVGPFLGVERAGYYQVDGDHFVISEEWRTPGSIDMRGRHPMAGFGQSTVDMLRAGGILRFDDTKGVTGAEAYAANGMAAVLSVPVHHEGRWAGGLHVFQSTPRAWTDVEEELIRNIGLQAWAAIERVRADEALRTLNDTLKQRVREAMAERDLMWEIAPDLMVVVDGDSAYRAVNPAWERILGWTEADLVGTKHFDLVHVDDLPLSQTALTLARSGQLDPVEIRMRHKDGSYRLVSWVGTSNGGLVFASGRDVTAEHEVAASLLLHENIVRSNASPIVAFDHDMRLIAFNEAHGAKFRQAYGIDQQIGDRLPDQFTDEQRPLLIELMQRALGGETFSLRAAFGDPALELLHWDITYNPLRDRTGAVIGAFHHAIDVSAQVRMEEDLAESRDALRQAQKMEAVGQLTGGLAHDFNNLLTGIMGNLELLQLRIARGKLDDLDRFILAAQGAGRRAASLTQRLLAFSRRQTLDPKPTDVNRLITGMEDMLRRTIGPANTLEVIGAGGLWTADIDAGQLENALLNLCINARDAMPDGGRITIETANKWLDDRAGRQRDLPPGQYLSICVTDTGTGMSAQTIERAFDPFFTTKPIGQGTGLGLSMIYGFARQSGGQVRIYSEIGMGTTMCIYLPRHTGDAIDDHADEVVAALANSGSGTVLVVDDEATIRHLVDEVLDDVGYTVIGAADGAAGIKVLQSGARIDLLITDVGLPNGMNGRQVADAARALRPGLKVLFITGYAENAAVGNGHMDPGMELLTKPFSLDALVTKVNDMMRRA